MKDRRYFEALGSMPLEKIIEMIEDKMSVKLSKSVYTFISLMIEQAYDDKWLSMDDPWILHKVRIEIRSFDEALDKWLAKFNPDECEKIGDWKYCEPKVLEYRDMGNWLCHDIREAIEPLCDRTKYGNADPFIGYCWSCWYEGVSVDLAEYEAIKAFIEG